MRDLDLTRYQMAGIETKGVYKDNILLIVHQDNETGLFFASPAKDLDILYCIASDRMLNNIVWS